MTEGRCRASSGECRVEGGRPLPLGPGDAPDWGFATGEDLAVLLPDLRGHPELDLKTLAYHLEQSDATAADGYCHAAINEARSFLEALIVNIFLAAQRDVVPGADGEGNGNGRDRSQNGTAFRTWRRYLCEMGFLDGEENELLQWVYGVASAKGSHHGVTDEAWTRLVRRIILATGHYLLHRYAAWKRDGRLAATPIQRRPASACRRWLRRVIRRLVRKV